jgi:hypothetical protein
MGTWQPDAASRDSTWRELRTLLHTMERKRRKLGLQGLRGTTLFYFTDNLVSYFVVHNGSSTSPGLHALIRRIKMLEVDLGCQVEAVHVPGKSMISQGTNGLSRGLWVAPVRLLRSSLEESRITLQATPWTPALGDWALERLGMSPRTRLHHHSDQDSWRFESIHGRWNIVTPSPEIARQTITNFLDFWVEDAGVTGAIFIVPQILQKQWGSLLKHVLDWGGAFHRLFSLLRVRTRLSSPASFFLFPDGVESFLLLNGWTMLPWLSSPDGTRPRQMLCAGCGEGFHG